MVQDFSDKNRLDLRGAGWASDHFVISKMAKRETRGAPGVTFWQGGVIIKYDSRYTPPRMARSVTPILLPAESITGCMFGANLVIAAQIYYN